MHLLTIPPMIIVPEATKLAWYCPLQGHLQRVKILISSTWIHSLGTVKIDSVGLDEVFCFLPFTLLHTDIGIPYCWYGPTIIHSLTVPSTITYTSLNKQHQLNATKEFIMHLVTAWARILEFEIEPMIPAPMSATFLTRTSKG